MTHLRHVAASRQQIALTLHPAVPSSSSLDAVPAPVLPAAEQKEEVALVTESKVSRNFQNKAIHSDLLSVPGIGKSNKKKLEAAGIHTTEDLVAAFWLHHRDPVPFAKDLTDEGIQDKYAQACAQALFQKFKGL